MKIEIRADGSLHIEGYVNAVERDSRTVICPECGKCVEQIRAGAFGEALRAAKNVDILLNHDKNKKLGSTSGGTLSLYEDNIGLRASTDITDEEVISEARAGRLRGWSFGFKRLASEIENRADNIPRRIVTALSLSEVSLIDDRFTPCYAGTSIELRANEETGEADEIELRFDDSEVEFTDNSASAYLSDWVEGYLKLIEAEERYNPYHDPTNGRFTSANGVGGSYLFVGKGQKGKGAYVVTPSKTKYNGVSVINSSGKRHIYIEQKGGYFLMDSHGATKRLDDRMQQMIKAKGGLKAAFKNNAAPIEDSEIDTLRQKHQKEREIIEKEKLSLLYGNTKSVNRHRGYWSAMG